METFQAVSRPLPPPRASRHQLGETLYNSLSLQPSNSIFDPFFPAVNCIHLFLGINPVGGSTATVFDPLGIRLPAEILAPVIDESSLRYCITLHKNHNCVRTLDAGRLRGLHAIFGSALYSR